MWCHFSRATATANHTQEIPLSTAYLGGVYRQCSLTILRLMLTFVTCPGHYFRALSPARLADADWSPKLDPGVARL